MVCGHRLLSRAKIPCEDAIQSVHFHRFIAVGRRRVAGLAEKEGLALFERQFLEPAVRDWRSCTGSGGSGWRDRKARPHLVLRQFGLSVEDGEQVFQSLLQPAKVADVSPVDGFGVLAEVVVGQLLQPRQLGVDLRCARGVVGDWIDVAHLGLRVDRDAVIHQFAREAPVLIPGMSSMDCSAIRAVWRTCSLSIFCHAPHNSAHVWLDRKRDLGYDQTIIRPWQ